MKRLLVLLLFATPVVAQTGYRGVVQTTTGQAVAGATITVCSYSSSNYSTSGNYNGPLPCTTPVSIYADPGLAHPISVLLSDGQGNFSFFAASGAYTVTITASGRINPYGFAISTQTGQSIYYAGPLPSYDAVAHGAVCNGNTGNVATDSAGILAAINAAIAASPAGGIVNIDNCVWLPPNPLPVTTAWITLQARTGFTITGTVHLRDLYKLLGQPNIGAQFTQFGTKPTAQITPIPASISPVVEMDNVASQGNPQIVQNISCATTFTGTCFQAGTPSLGVAVDQWIDDIAVSNATTAVPFIQYGGFGLRLHGGSYAPGLGSTNPSITLTSISASDPVRDVDISGSDDTYLTINLQGIEVNALPAANGACSTDLVFDKILYENAQTSGYQHMIYLDSTYTCFQGIRIVEPIVSDPVGVAAILSTGSGAQAILDVEVWLPANPVTTSAPIFSGTKAVSGIIHMAGTATTANLGTGVNWGGIILDGSGIFYAGGNDCAAGGFCGIFGGLYDDADTAASWNIYKSIPNPTLANLSLNQRTSETGDLLDWKNSSKSILGHIDAGGNMLAPSYRAPLTTPSSSSATCVAGVTAWDANYVYVCTATNTWKRTALTTF